MLTGVVLTRNEAGQIGKCLRNLQFCDELIVVDDASTDETIKIAKQAGARVLEHELSGDYAAQRNWAISQVKSGWILFVDADEVVLSQLAKEITAAITKVECKGFWLTRTDFMWGKQLKHGDVGQVKLVRLSRKGAGQWVGKVHETWLIEGQVCSLKAPLQHYPHPTMEAFLRHINQYSTLRARELKATGVKATIW
ncbi:MAG: glycosyltransferase family 2 protein, partial [bacterium]|nr:glycosyltransferase family 2 protein [bacterium]